MEAISPISSTVPQAALSQSFERTLAPEEPYLVLGEGCGALIMMPLRLEDVRNELSRKARSYVEDAAPSILYLSRLLVITPRRAESQTNQIIPAAGSTVSSSAPGISMH